MHWSTCPATSAACLKNLLYLRFSRFLCVSGCIMLIANFSTFFRASLEMNSARMALPALTTSVCKLRSCSRNCKSRLSPVFTATSRILTLELSSLSALAFCNGL